MEEKFPSDHEKKAIGQAWISAVEFLLLLVLLLFNTIFVTSHMHPANREGTQVIV